MYRRIVACNLSPALTRYESRVARKCSRSTRCSATDIPRDDISLEAAFLQTKIRYGLSSTGNALSVFRFGSDIATLRSELVWVRAQACRAVAKTGIGLDVGTDRGIILSRTAARHAEHWQNHEKRYYNKTSDHTSFSIRLPRRILGCCRARCGSFQLTGLRWSPAFGASVRQ